MFRLGPWRPYGTVNDQLAVYTMPGRKVTWQSFRLSDWRMWRKGTRRRTSGCSQKARSRPAGGMWGMTWVPRRLPGLMGTAVTSRIGIYYGTKMSQQLSRGQQLPPRREDQGPGRIHSADRQTREGTGTGGAGDVFNMEEQNHCSSWRQLFDL